MTTQSDETRTTRTPLMMGLIFAALIIGTNMIFTEATRVYITKSLRSPNGEVVRDALFFVTAFRGVGRTAVMDSDSFVRLRLIVNFSVLAAFFAYVGFFRSMKPTAGRLSFRLLSLMGVVYVGILLFDPVALGQSGSAIEWFQSAGFVACGTAAVLNWVMVKRLARNEIHRTPLTTFWFLAAFVCFFAALETRFGLTSSLYGTAQVGLAQKGIIHVYKASGMPLSDLAPPIVSLVIIVATLFFLRPLRQFLDAHESKWDAPLVFALILQVIVSTTLLLPKSDAITPWLTQVTSLANTAIFVLVLAAFSTTAFALGERYLVTSLAPQPRVTMLPASSSQEPSRPKGPPIIVSEDADVPTHTSKT